MLKFRKKHSWQYYKRMLEVDDIFTIVSLACVLLWLLAMLIRHKVTASLGRTFVRFVLSWQSYMVALIIIALFRITLYEMFWIPSASMQPTLREGEFVIVDKNDFGIRVPLLGFKTGRSKEPERGQIVVFNYPLQPDLYYIKRIIGVPGDNIVIDGNTVILDGNVLAYSGPSSNEYIYNEGGVLSESEIISSEILWERLPDGWHSLLLTSLQAAPAAVLNNDACESSASGRQLVCTVPADSYFVMGDNRHRSNDSRIWGFVPRSHLIGPAFTVAISFDDFSRSFTGLGLTAEAAPIDDHIPPTTPEP